jgi:hypothetical protein
LPEQCKHKTILTKTPSPLLLVVAVGESVFYLVLMDSNLIQANAEFVNGKHFHDLVDILDCYELKTEIYYSILIRTCALIGFKDENMQRIADIQAKKEIKV